LKNFEIKISKKTRGHFKKFVQSRIQIFKAMCPTKFDKVQNSVKSEKPSGFLPLSVKLSGLKNRMNRKPCAPTAPNPFIAKKKNEVGRSSR
jgi:hypothetical protein